MSAIQTSTQTDDSYGSVQFTPRLSQERGGANHGWLKTFHTFSFASYQDGGHEAFRQLRVLNEDRVAPFTGFGEHGHREFEIFSYVVSGELEHKDSMGNIEILKRGDIQLTSAGTGIRHSEKAHGGKEVHFLQIWSIPSISRLQPKYFTRHFTDEEKKDKLVPVVAPINTPGVSDQRVASGPTPVQSPVTLYASILSPSVTVKHIFQSPAAVASKRYGYLHVIQTSNYNTGQATGATIQVNGKLRLAEGDATYIEASEGDVVEIINVGNTTAELLFFDLD